MLRWIVVVGLLVAVAGCGESRRTRVVPVTAGATSQGEDTGARAVTRPPRAIATH